MKLEATKKLNAQWAQFPLALCVPQEPTYWNPIFLIQGDTRASIVTAGSQQCVCEKKETKQKLQDTVGQISALIPTQSNCPLSPRIYAVPLKEKLH
jgi:hypothetical protein